MKLWDCLSERGKREWPRIYKKFKRKEWALPEKDKRAIRCEPKPENIEEIDKLMRQAPNYPLDVQGRES